MLTDSKIVQMVQVHTKNGEHALFYVLRSDLSSFFLECHIVLSVYVGNDSYVYIQIDDILVSDVSGVQKSKHICCCWFFFLSGFFALFQGKFTTIGELYSEDTLNR